MGGGGRRGAGSPGEAAVSRDREATAMSQVSYCEATQADAAIGADADLVSQLRAGDQTAIARLVDEWSPTMLRVARSFVDSPQSAEDVVQEAWLGMLSGLARFEGRSSLRTWTFSILVNRARTCGAREARTLAWSPLDSREGSAVEDRLARSGGEHPWKWASIDVPSRWDTIPENVAVSREVLHQLAPLFAGPRHPSARWSPCATAAGWPPAKA